MKKYFVTKMDYGYGILKESFDSMGGNYCSNMMDGFETEQEAERLCFLMNRCYEEGREDLTKNASLIPSEQTELLKAGIKFLQDREANPCESSVQEFLTKIRHGELTAFSLSYQYVALSPTLTFVAFAHTIEEAISLLKVYAKDNDVIITSIVPL